MRPAVPYQSIVPVFLEQHKMIFELFIERFKIPVDICNACVEHVFGEYNLWFNNDDNNIFAYTGRLKGIDKDGSYRWSFDLIDNPSLGKEFLSMTSASYIKTVWSSVFSKKAAGYSLEIPEKAILLNTDTFILIGLVLYDIYIQMTLQEDSNLISVSRFDWFLKNPNRYNLFLTTLCRYLAGVCIVYDVPCWVQWFLMPSEDEKFTIHRFIRSSTDRMGFEDYNIQSNIFPVVYPDFDVPKPRPHQ